MVIVYYYIIIHVDFLSSGNMREVLDLIWDYRSRWKFIGIVLGVDPGTLDAIEKDHNKAEDSLVELIGKWLRGSRPKPTQSALTIALQSRQVADGISSVQGV